MILCYLINKNYLFAHQDYNKLPQYQLLILNFKPEIVNFHFKLQI